MNRLQELVRLHRMGTGAREVARLLGMSPNTERMYRGALSQAGLLEGPVDALPELATLQQAVAAAMPPPVRPVQEVSSVETWTERVTQLMDRQVGPRAIYDRLRLEEPGFAGSYPAIKRLCRAIARARGVRAEDVVIPVHTAPGEVAQVDFVYVGKLYDPEEKVLRRAWCFLMVLGFSRHMVARVVFDQKVSTWLTLHVEAFAELGGVVETVVPDNLKSAVIRAAFAVDDTTDLNRSYRELARHYGFKIDPTPPRSPEKKGKVESGAKYVGHNFFRGRDKTDVNLVREQLGRWVRDVAGMRTHGTTGRRPLEDFETVERASLRPLPATGWDPVVWRQATVHPDCCVSFERHLYSVPWKLVGQKVWLRATRSTVAVYASDVRVATHSRGGPATISDEHLPEHRRELRHRSRAYWEERADAIGADAGQFIREVFDSDDVLSRLRTVQAMVTHLETYPRLRANAACARARHFGNHTYGGLKNILRKALDLLPVPTTTTAPAAPQQPRFARNIGELWSHHEEDGHGYH